jgi:2-C-methyl-D-erythritol 4-phosphate cytidylyltransferase
LSSKENQPSFAVVLTAGGIGSRMGQNAPKQFLELDGKSILEVSLDGLLPLIEEGLSQVVVSYPTGFRTEIIKVISKFCESAADFCFEQESAVLCCITLCEGGTSRQISVFNALSAISVKPEFVFIHDAVRPFASADLYKRMLREIVDPQTSAVVPLLKINDTVKRVRNAEIDFPRIVCDTVDRDSLCLVQTPQLFRLADILELHQHAARDNFFATDDVSLMEHFTSGRIIGIEGEANNIKITRPADFEMAEYILQQRKH